MEKEEEDEKQTVSSFGCVRQLGNWNFLLTMVILYPPFVARI